MTTIVAGRTVVVEIAVEGADTHTREITVSGTDPAIRETSARMAVAEAPQGGASALPELRVRAEGMDAVERELRADDGDVVALLARLGIDEPARGAFARLLVERRKTVTVRILESEGSRQVADCLAWIDGGPLGSVLVTPDADDEDAPWLDITPASGDEIRDAVTDLIMGGPPL